MEIQALTRNARMSPKKVREVARLIQGRPVNEAIDFLTLVPRKSARLLVKTLKSAVANTKNNNSITAGQLTVHRALIENGPVLKRFKAGARARPSRASSACRTSASFSPTAKPTNFSHGTKDQPYRLPPRRSPQLAVALVRAQEGFRQTPPSPRSSAPR